MCDRHIELVAVGVLDGHVLVLAAAVADRAHLQEAADAMVLMDDEVAWLELDGEQRPSCASHGCTSRSASSRRLHAPRAAAKPAPPARNGAEELGVRVDTEPGVRCDEPG